jgi:hypothetical protein
MSEEGSSSLGDCYIPSYHLSDQATFAKFPNFTSAKHYHGMSNEGIPLFFHGNTLINWAIFTQPRHPVFRRALENAVELLRSEYVRRSFVYMTQWDKKWKHVMCTTGFTLTYTVRELELENNISPELLPRISSNNFREYRGNVKAFWTGGDQNHYMKAMEKPKSLKLLKEYGPISLESIVRHLEGRTVMGDEARSIYFIRNGSKFGFGDYEFYTSIKFAEKNPRHISDVILQKIPDGGIISNATLIYETIAMAAASKHVSSSSSSFSSLSSRRPAHSQDVKTADHQLRTIVANSSSIANFLRNATEYLNSIKVTCFGDDYAGTRDDFLAGTYKNVLGDLPVLVYPFCARTFQLGNTLGYYLNDIACADISGSHFIAVHKEFKLISKDTLFTKKEKDQLTFFNALPDLIENSAPQAAEAVRSNMKKDCQCLQYCWENTAAPWIRRIPLIGSYLRRAVDEYVSNAGGAANIPTVLNNATDKTTAWSWGELTVSNSRPQITLPLIPDVTIQYRCGDNIGFGKTRYGLLPFKAFNTARIDGDTSKFIYIIADSPTRNPDAAIWSSRCEVILDHLFENLKKKFPSSTIVLKRGGDAFLDYARIVYSKVVICSASTFCLWPSLANQNGTVYFPLTPLVAGATSNITAPNLASNFNWITEVEMIKNFRNYRPWTQLLGDLES